MKFTNNQQGFSLMELLIGTAILTIVMAAVFGVLSASLKSQQYSFDEGANIQDARAVLNEASSQLRNATEISAPAEQVAANSITYRLAGDTVDRTIVLGTTAPNVGYVVITDPSGTKKYGSGRVTSINFVYAYVPTPSVPPCRREITIRVQVKNSARSDAPLSDLTTSVVTMNAF